jgi:hypothetical protein
VLVLQQPPPSRSRRDAAEVVTAWLDRFEARLYSTDPAERRAAGELVDVRSFVELAILLEVTRNADALKTSTFFSLSGAGPLVAGPPWDFDVALGNDRIAVDPTGWQVLLPREGRSPWWPRLAEDPDVGQAFADRWRTLREGPLASGAVRARVRALAASIAEAALRNFSRWPVLGRRIGPNPDALATWGEEVAALEGWLDVRLRWLDAQWPAPPRVASGGGRAVLVVDEGEVFAAPGDPRAPGGGVAEGAVRLEGIPPERTVLAALPGRTARCGATAAVTFRVPPQVEDVEVETAAPPRDGFRLLLDGEEVAARPSLAIVRPLAALGSAVHEDGLRVRYVFAAPLPGVRELAVTAIGGGGARGREGCAIPALRVVAVRPGRYEVGAGGPAVARVRVRRGERWSAPVNVPAAGQ